jgi:hypothetical protein
MLKVAIHAGTLDERELSNQLAVLDIAYHKKAALADYLVALSLRGSGATAPAFVRSYPRWSASLWDLTARALTQALYRADQVPSSHKPDRRCAYATRVCATIERMTAGDHGLELGTVEIVQRGKQRGLYTASFNEDVLGPKNAEFEYGCKALNHAELLLRAICWAYFKTDVLGPKPKLIVPQTLSLEGAVRFHVAALDEPALTGFRRHRAAAGGNVEAGLEDLPLADGYVRFLMEG